jgi:hypothetical protein
MLGLTGTTMMHQAISSLNIITDRKRQKYSLKIA